MQIEVQPRIYTNTVVSQEIDELTDSLNDLQMIAWENENALRHAVKASNKLLSVTTALDDKTNWIIAKAGEETEELRHKNTVLTVMIIAQYVALAALALCR